MHFNSNRYVLRPYSKSKLELNSKKVFTRVMQKIFSLCLCLSFLHLKPNFRYSSLSFVRLSWRRTTDKVAIN